jgi:hypothetical protein
MNITLSDILTEMNDVIRRSASGALDNNKRTRAVNRALRYLRTIGDWDPTVREKTFTFTDGTYEYSLETDLTCTALSNDGSTSVPDFKNPLRLHRADDSETPFRYRDAREVRSNIGRNRKRNEFGIDGDTIVINYEPQDTTETMHLDYYSLAMVKNAAGNHQVEFNADSVTQTDYLIDERFMPFIIEWIKGDGFALIGGKNEAERRDAMEQAANYAMQLRRSFGRAIKRPTRGLTFPGSR